ncbi:hypothetical protein MMC14_008429 [Varicellaria rhodocarpa]|nr:hypothetical protein [Varicellaria rhodocarpa]
MKARDLYLYEERAFVVFWNTVIWTIGLATSFYGLASKILPQEPQSSYSNVSGYYGPGACLAWYITAVTLGVRTLVFKAQSDECEEEKSSPNFKINGDVLATTAYPLVAFFDTTVQLFYSILSGTPLSAEFMAGLFVLELATTLAFFIVTLDRERDSPKRHWAQRVLCIITIFIGHGSIIEDWTSPKVTWHGVLKSIFCTMIAFDRHIYYHNRAAKPLLLAVHVVGQSVVRSHLPPYTLLPKTSSRFTDLDQIAAFVTTIVALVFPWKDQLYSLYWHIWEYVFHHEYDVSGLIHKVIQRFLHRRRIHDDVVGA